LRRLDVELELLRSNREDGHGALTNRNTTCSILFDFAVDYLD
jgi:hypothetical protein